MALTYEGHVHHAVARDWFEGVSSASRLFFSRFTQLGLLRLLTAEAVMGRDEVMGQTGAWQAYDRWMQDDRVEFLDEPAGLEAAFRALSRSPRPAPKEWADSYLAAFASASRLLIVTLDGAFRDKVKDAVILGPK